METTRHTTTQDMVTIRFDLPGEIYDLLNAKHSKGALGAIRTAIALYIKNGRPVKNAERDQAIYLKCQTMRQAAVAKEYKLSLIRVQQICAAQKAKEANQ